MYPRGSDDSAQQVAHIQFQAQLVDALPDPVVATDRDFRIRLLNPAAELLYGRSLGEVRGTHVRELGETQFATPAARRDAERTLLADGRWSGEVRQRTGDGTWVEIDATALQLLDDDGTVFGALFIARDVTRTRRAERDSADRHDFADAVLESLPGRTCVVDKDGMIVVTNRRYRQEGPAGVGESTGPGLHANYRNWLRQTVSAEAAEELGAVLRGTGHDFRTEFATVRRRKRYWTEVFAVPLGTSTRGAVITHVDITARKQAETTLTKRATHDPLTGLPNRVLLADRLAHALSRAARTKSQVGLLFCDLDGFRGINNTHGHLAGDKLLVTVAKRLRAVCRSSDTVARVSGDEFVIILEDVAGRAEVEEVARRIIDALAEPVVLENGTARTGTSIGLVISSGVPRAGVRTVETLVGDADAAMYAAKEIGRGRYAWFSPEMHERPRERPTFAKALTRLLTR